MLIEPGAVVIPAKLCGPLLSLLKGQNGPAAVAIADLIGDLQKAAANYSLVTQRSAIAADRINRLEQQVARFGEITPPSREEVTVRQASKLLSQSVRRVQQMAKEGRLLARQTGGQWWISLADVEAYKAGAVRERRGDRG